MIRLHDALDRARGKDQARVGDGDGSSAGYRTGTDHLPGGPWAEDIDNDLAQLDEDTGPREANIDEPDTAVGDRPSFVPRRRSAVLAASGLLLVAALAVYGTLVGAGSSTDTFEVSRGSIHKVVSARGRIEPMAEIRISASTLGKIAAVLVNEGDDVAQGQVLAQMDDSELRAQVAQAEARLEEALARQAEIELGPRPQEVGTARAREREARAVLQEATEAFERMRVLTQGGLVAAAELDTARGRRDVATAQHQAAIEHLALVESGSREEVKQAARAQVKRARADADYARALLEQTTIRAPVAGRIIHRFMNPGEVIALQRPQPIVTLADTSRIHVRAEIDESDARFIRAGQPVTLTSDAVQGQEFSGAVIEVGTTAGRKSLMSENPAEPVDTKVVEALISLTDSFPWTFGTNVDASITVDRREDVLVVPQSAVQTVDGKTTVFVRDGNQKRAQPVELGANDDAFAEVRGGLSVGDVIFR